MSDSTTLKHFGDEAYIIELEARAVELEIENERLAAANFGLLNTITSCQITIKELDNRNAELEAKNTFWACEDHTHNNTLRCALCDENRITELEYRAKEDFETIKRLISESIRLKSQLPEENS